MNGRGAFLIGLVLTSAFVFGMIVRDATLTWPPVRQAIDEMVNNPEALATLVSVFITGVFGFGALIGTQYLMHWRAEMRASRSRDERAMSVAAVLTAEAGGATASAATLKAWLEISRKRPAAVDNVVESSAGLIADMRINLVENSPESLVCLPEDLVRFAFALSVRLRQERTALERAAEKGQLPQHPTVSLGEIAHAADNLWKAIEAFRDGQPIPSFVTSTLASLHRLGSPETKRAVEKIWPL